MTGSDPLGLRRPGPEPRREVEFTFEGRKLTGIEGEPIAAALHAQGIKVLGRSMKYHRPRGLHCVDDACPNCAMRVNGLPGVTTCSTPLRAGDEIGRERGTPNADRDALGLMGTLDRFTPAGFQYRRFRRSPRLFRIWERVLARLAASGEVPDRDAARKTTERAGWTVRETGVAVVGGGPAGLSAALAAAESGAGVLLVERHPGLGGHPQPDPDEGGRHAETDPNDLKARVESTGGIEVMTDATAAGWFAEGVLAVTGSFGTVEVRPQAVVLATGTHERPLAFPDNDRPGIMLAGGVERLLRSHALLPGLEVVIVAGENSGYGLAAELDGAGSRIVAVANLRDAPEAGTTEGMATLRGGGTRFLTGVTVTGVRGRSAVTGIRLSTVADGEVELSCDTVVIANGRRPARELLFQRAATGGLGLKVPAKTKDPAPDPAVPVVDGWWLAGSVAGTCSLEDAARSGAAAGRAAAEALSP